MTRAWDTHETVLRAEVRALAAVRPGERWVDCTLGYGGHSADLLEAGASVTGLDQDARALAAACARLEGAGDGFRALQANFRDLSALASVIGVHDGAGLDGVLADIGVSSPQLETPARGFSFRARGPVDMRMNPDAGETAFALIARLDAAELTRVIGELGEEPFAGRIARAVKAWASGEGPHDTTTLAGVISAAVPAKVAHGMRHHPATRTFQALRIAVNDELGALDALLDAAPRLLAPGGRFLVISFHSLEDRRVKTAFATLCGRRRPQAPRRGLPPPPAVEPDFDLLTPHGLTAGEDEVLGNPRARSARLRAIRRRLVSAPSGSSERSQEGMTA